jgi:hypothetical protein
MTSDLAFDPPPECDRDGCCDLSCVWPSGDPLRWEGDDS